MTENTKNPICCICGCECENKYGNNPWPVVKDEGAKCCNHCDQTVVLPERIRRMIEQKRKENLKTEKLSMRISKRELRMLDELCLRYNRNRPNVIITLIELAYRQMTEDKE
jgi:hypothetical protein